MIASLGQSSSRPTGVRGRGDALTESVYPPRDAVCSAVAAALREDLGRRGDLTARLLPVDAQATARFVAREQGVVAGIACATETYRRISPTPSLIWQVDDGTAVKAGDVVGVVSGPLRSIVTGERTALNFLCHLSGVATATRRFVDAVRAVNPACQIRDTRKTTPGLRVLEKAAVRAGGGVNHRGGLSDGVLVKDNHLSGISLEDAVRKALRRYPGVPVQVECDTEEQVEAAIRAGAPMVLLDNMTPAQVAACADLAHKAGVKVEASGRIGLDTVAEYARAGADFISVGRITHSALILDIGLDIEAGL